MHRGDFGGDTWKKGAILKTLAYLRESYRKELSRNGMGAWIGCIWLGTGGSGGSFGHGNEIPVFAELREFLVYLGNCQILKNGCALWSLLVCWSLRICI